MNRILKTTLYCLLGSLFFVAGLVLHSRSFKDNGFNRFYRKDFLKDGERLDLKHNSWYMAGSDSSHIYLGNYASPGKMIIVNQRSLEKQYLNLIIPTERNMTVPQMFIRVRSPYIYLMSGNSRLILRGKIGERLMRVFITNTPSFYAHFGLPISDSSFVVKTYDKQQKQYILSKISHHFHLVSSNPKSLKKQIDGAFCTEGVLAYDATDAKLVFIYTYRNEYLSFNSSLDIIAKGRTIDTNQNAKIQLDTIKSKDQLVFSKPPLKVNGVSTIAHQMLFVHSKLRASNEERQTYHINSSIDVYSLPHHTYSFSFYIPDVEEQKVTGIFMNKNALFTLQGQYLVKYPLKQTL